MEISTALNELAPRVRIASNADRVFKDECMFSFDSPYSPDGLFTNLATFESFGALFVAQDAAKRKPAVYFHQRHVKVPKKEVNTKEESKESKPTKLAIGGDGGFVVDPNAQFEVVKHDEVVFFDRTTNVQMAVPVESPLIPVRIQQAIEAIVQHAGNVVTEHVAAWEEQRLETKYAEHLVQIENPPHIPANPSAWKCQAPTCDKQENLWLNLSDGFIGCGRQIWDGTGGCGEALKHYADTGGIYPLAVKLGTITPDGGDVYSYAPDEDDMVTNKHLATHLKHFGINIQNLRKTDKTMDELQVGLNLSYEFDTITESGKKLVPLTGAGFIGLSNLGNSCYMNSVLQMLLTLPELQYRYFQAAEKLFQTCSTCPADDFPAQFAKLACGTQTDRYSRDLSKNENDFDDGSTIPLRPSTFRSLVGKGHPDFSTSQQQDAAEYFLHLLEFMNRSERAAGGRITGMFDDDANADPALSSSELFKFDFEDRVECLASHKVKYVSREDVFFQVNIPLEAATNATQVKEYQALEQKRQRLKDGAAQSTEEAVIPNVPFDKCLEKTMAPELIGDFLSSATGTKGFAQKQVRFKNFPRYLAVQMRRFFVDENWTATKLDANVVVPEELNLGTFLSGGLQVGEELLPEEQNAAADTTSSTTTITPDETIVVQAMSMGFSENAGKRAAIATGNSGAEAAMEWIITHMDDPDLNDPPVQATSAASTSSFNAEHVANLSSMGFTTEQVQCALQQTSHNPDRAAEWLFSHMDDLDSAVASCAQDASSNSTSTESASKAQLASTLGEYKLVGFISHIGRNTGSGHYVCHIKKQGQWVIFNDDKVAVSEAPPFGAGYLYFFRRADVVA